MPKVKHVVLGMIVLVGGVMVLGLAIKVVLRLLLGAAVVGAVIWVGYKLTRKVE